MNKADFPSVKFNSLGFSRYGYAVGEHLAVAYSSASLNCNTYQVFVILTGKPLTGKIQTFDDAVKIAQTINEIYKEYALLWSDAEWAGQDVFQLCQYSVPGGRHWAKVFGELRQRDQITLDTLKNAYYVAMKG